MDRYGLARITSWIVIVTMLVASIGGSTVTALAQGTKALAGGAQVEWGKEWSPVSTAWANESGSRLTLSPNRSAFGGGVFLGIEVLATPMDSLDDTRAVEIADAFVMNTDPYNLIESEDNLDIRVVNRGVSTTPNQDGTSTLSEVVLVNIVPETMQSDWFVYLQLDNNRKLMVLSTLDQFTEYLVGSAWKSIRIDGEGFSTGTDTKALVWGYYNARNAAADKQTAEAPKGGEWTSIDGLLHVTWPAGWVIVDLGDRIILNSTSYSIMIMVLHTGGMSFFELGHLISWGNPIVTDSGFVGSREERGGFVATYEEWGEIESKNAVTLSQGIATVNPDYFVYIEMGVPYGAQAGLAQYVAEAQAEITVNGEPILTGIEQVLPPAE